MTNRHCEILPINKENRDIKGKPPVYSVRNNNTRRQINYDNVPWEGNDTSYLQLPNIRQQTGLEQFSMNDTTDIRLCHRCGGEGHIRKYCKINVHCDFCKSYSHHTSVCRSYANFVRAHPMASSRRASRAHTNKQTDWMQLMTQVERTDIPRQQKYKEDNSENDPTRRRLRNYKKTLGVSNQHNESIIHMQCIRPDRKHTHQQPGNTVGRQRRKTSNSE